MIDEKLLEILGCPLEDNRPRLRQEGNWLVCSSCGAKFPIQDGIPNLLPEAAVTKEHAKETNV